jgi:hypothetical protein
MKNSCAISYSVLLKVRIFDNVCLVCDKSSYPQSLHIQCVDYNMFSDILVPVIVFLIVYWQKD